MLRICNGLGLVEDLVLLADKPTPQDTDCVFAVVTDDSSSIMCCLTANVLLVCEYSPRWDSRNTKEHLRSNLCDLRCLLGLAVFGTHLFVS